MKLIYKLYKTLDNKLRLTIPSQVAKKINLKPNQELILEIYDNGIIKIKGIENV